MEIGESVVQSVILHQVGNRLREEPLIMANQCFSMTDSISNLILGGYLRGIVNSKNEYVLTHESDMALNDVAYHVSDFFAQKTSFIDLSQKLATHLYASTHHPNIAAGDLFVIKFDRLKVDGKYRSAIGIYKSESKQQYISARTDGTTQQLEVSIGINPDLIDKGVLIVDGAEIIYAIDRISSRTKYWIDDFLKAKQVPNERTKSSVVIGVIEKICKTIENPVARQEFSQEIATLCSDREEVRGEEIKEISERYASPDVWESELNRIVERRGLASSGEINIPTKSLETKLKRVLSRISLGHDITLIIPNGLSFNNVDFKTNDRTIQISVILENSNG